MHKLYEYFQPSEEKIVDDNVKKQLRKCKTPKDFTNPQFGDVVYNNYPPAQCCYRYKTEGTESGNWYLPSCLELMTLYCGAHIEDIADYGASGKVMINAILGYINSHWTTGNYMASLSTIYNYWSSSEYSCYSAFSVSVW